MPVNDLNLGDLRSIRGVLSRLPDGTAALELATRLGLWSEPAHTQVIVRKVFPRNLSELTPAQVSDEYAYWTSEFGRLSELAGALNGARERNRSLLTRARNVARASVRREHAEEKISATEVKELAEEKPEVAELDEQSGFIELVSASVKAALDATSQYLTTLSREITQRDSQSRNRA